MNANELAEIADSLVIEIPIREWVDNEPKNVITDIATMLRQQQAEIDALKKEAALQRLSDFTQEADNEPVAWARQDGVIAFHKQKEVDSQGFKWFPLYTHPVKDLEDIDINITWNENSMRDFGKDKLNFAKAILKKAQEK
jgi:hypothetical protein